MAVAEIIRNRACSITQNEVRDHRWISFGMSWSFRYIGVADDFPEMEIFRTKKKELKEAGVTPQPMTPH
ncbi:MAG: hypothetical protein LLG40_14630 [Deltaproteobacteria bacterium]|nr:hypothetical protein [Deltaproteobacteria bacterium]